MSRKFFTSLPDWTRIREWLEEQSTAHREAAFDALAKNNVNDAQYERGYYDALRTVLEAPENLLKDADGEEQPEPEAEGPKLRVVPEQAKPHKLSRPF